MAFNNVYPINVDIKRRLTSVVPTFKQGDNGGLKFKIYDNGRLFDLSNYTHSEITFKLPNGESLVGNPELIDGELVYYFNRVEMAVVGKVETVLSIMSGDSMVSLQPFTCFIFDSMKNENLSYVGILQDLIKETQDQGLSIEGVLHQVADTLGLVGDELNDLHQYVSLVERAELMRNIDEDARQSNEQDRLNSEIHRVRTENARISNESTRVNAEDVRIQNESTRQSNEVQRQNRFTAKINEFDGKINVLDEVKALPYHHLTTYRPPNFVTYNGSTYVVLQTVTGITPSDDGINYRLAAQRGVDGTGSVSTINGISPNEDGNVELSFVSQEFIDHERNETNQMHIAAVTSIPTNLANAGIIMKVDGAFPTAPEMPTLDQFEEDVREILDDYSDNMQSFQGQVAQQLADYEKIVDGEISVQQFGADKTGASNDTEAFQSAVNYARQVMIQSNFSESVTVVLNGGIYNIDERIIISPFVKLATKGFVVIKSNVVGDSTFHFTGQVGDPTFLNVMEKQQYQRGKFIDASRGGMLITHVENKLSGTIGIEIGSRTDIGRNLPTSRYAISDVAITRFECGLQMNHFNNYIGVFERLHLEINTVNVRFGTTISSVVNSGENFNFYGCLFAGAERGFDWYVDGMDCNFYGCSFDFIDNLFYLRRGWKKIGVYGGHIESINNKICTFTEGGSSGLRPTLTIDSALVYCNGYNLFSGEIFVTLSSVRWARTIRQPNMYVVTDDVNLSITGNFSRQGLITTLARQLNRLSNPRFEKVDISGGDAVEPFSNYIITRFGFSPVSITSTMPNGASNTKAMKFTPTGSSGAYVTLTLEKVPCNSGQNVEAMVNVYQALTARTVHFAFFFYDDEDNLISSTSPFSNNGAHAVNTWYSVKSTTINIAPPRTKNVSVRITLGGQGVGEDVYIDEFYMGVI